MARPRGAHDDSRVTRPVRDPGDAWVESPSGEKFWGRFGAAGLLVHDPAQGVLLQHRAQWSHFGGTWGIPGGALQLGEEAVAAALREAHEEAGVPVSGVHTRATRVIDREVWSYTTVIAEVAQAFTPVVGDAESVELAWVAISQVTDRPLHPAFGQAWPVLAQLLHAPPVVVVVDAANVVGSVPNGWWRDRQGATQRLVDRLAQLVSEGLPAPELGLDAATWYASMDVVVEGAARAVVAPSPALSRPGTPATAGTLSVTAAPAVGDDQVVAQARSHLDDQARVVVVTSDRELQTRVASLGAEYRSVSWLLDMLAPPTTPDRAGKH